MKYLVDTCGWIEWLTEGSLLKFFEKYIQNTSELLIPTIIQFELYKWICRERNEVLALNVIGITEQCHIQLIDTHLALSAAEVALTHQLAMADAIIYACAQFHQVQLITCDAHFKDLPGVIYQQKI